MYGPCDGVMQLADPLTDHWYEAIVAVAGHATPITIGWPGSTVPDET